MDRRLSLAPLWYLIVTPPFYQPLLRSDSLSREAMHQQPCLAIFIIMDGV
jgi:hypothetical protein